MIFLLKQCFYFLLWAHSSQLLYLLTEDIIMFSFTNFILVLSLFVFLRKLSYKFEIDFLAYFLSWSSK